MPQRVSRFGCIHAGHEPAQGRFSLHNSIAHLTAGSPTFKNKKSGGLRLCSQTLRFDWHCVEAVPFPIPCRTWCPCEAPLDRNVGSFKRRAMRLVTWASRSIILGAEASRRTIKTLPKAALRLPLASTISFHLPARNTVFDDLRRCPGSLQRSER
jgi:hypothetical protein